MALRPPHLADLPVIPHLPLPVRLLAEFYLACPRTTPDYLYLLAEACDELSAELVHRPPFDPKPARACADLAATLRTRAPSYA